MEQQVANELNQEDVDGVAGDDPLGPCYAMFFFCFVFFKSM